MGLSHPFESILAAAEALKDDAAVVFQFVGAGPGRAVVERAIREKHLPIQLLDFQPADQLADMLAAADVCLVSQHAALFDHALPHKIYAALAARRRAIFIGNARSEIVDWFRDADRGLHVEQGDSMALIAAIQKLRGDSLAKLKTPIEFTAARAAQAWTALLDGILSKRP